MDPLDTHAWHGATACEDLTPCLWAIGCTLALLVAAVRLFA